MTFYRALSLGIFLITLLFLTNAPSGRFSTEMPDTSVNAIARRLVASRSGVNGDPAWLITAYTAGFESTQKHPGQDGYGIAANGKPIQTGDCACDTSIPFGTRFEIDGLGTYTCTDRGGAVVGHHIDLYMRDLKDALTFGRQRHRVRIIR